MLRQLANTPTIAIAPGDGQHTFMQSSRSSRLAAQHFRCREGTGHVALLHRNVTANLGTAHADCQETDLNRVKTAGAARTGSLRQRRCCVQASGCSSKTWLCKHGEISPETMQTAKSLIAGNDLSMQAAKSVRLEHITQMCTMFALLTLPCQHAERNWTSCNVRTFFLPPFSPSLGVNKEKTEMWTVLLAFVSSGVWLCCEFQMSNARQYWINYNRVHAYCTTHST